MNNSPPCQTRWPGASCICLTAGRRRL
jgi:hypothetical protein